MAKQSQIEKAIAALEADRAVLDLAIAKLKAQVEKQPTRKLRTTKPRIVPAAS